MRGLERELLEMLLRTRLHRAVVRGVEGLRFGRLVAVGAVSVRGVDEIRLRKASSA